MEARNVGVGAIQRSASGGVRSRGQRTWAALVAGDYNWCPDIDYLADGVTSSVYRCRHANTGEFFAIKVFKSSPPVRELELLQKLKHSNIVRLIAREQFYDSSGLRTGLVLEYCPGGSLHDFLKRPENWLGLGDSDFLTLLYNMSDGLAYLREQQKVLHRDIKPGNILISWDSKRQPVFKLADFGSSRELEDDGEFQSLVGTYEFLHPSIYMEVYRRLHAGTHAEPRQQAGGHKPECDLWSLGVTLYQAATGQLPFAPYEGVRNNHKQMIDIMVNKPEGKIRAVQDSADGTVRYSDSLPAECHLSDSVRRLLVAILQGILACDFNVQWSFAKFFEIVSAQRSQHATYYFVAGSMFRPDLLFSPKPTYESLLHSLSERTGYGRDEIVVYYRSQAVTAFPTGTTPTCPIIVLSKQRFACSLSADQLDFEFVSRRPRDPDASQVKAVKDYVDDVYRMGLACQDVAKAAHLNHSLVLEAKEATMSLFRQRSQEAQQRAGSKIAMVSSSQQKVGRLLELAMLVRAQAPDKDFSDRVMDWHKKLEAVSSGLQDIQSELPASSGDAALDKLSESFNSLFASFGQPALAAECLSSAFQRAELVHERYAQIVAMFKRGHNPYELVRAGFPSDHHQLGQCVEEFQRVVRTCCVETLMSVCAKYDEWLRRVQDEVRRVASLEQRLQLDIEAELDLLHDKICRGTHEVLRAYFCGRNASRETDFMTLNKAIQGLIESTDLVQDELTRNSQLLRELDELGLRNSGLSSLESHASAESQ